MHLNYDERTRLFSEICAIYNSCDCSFSPETHEYDSQVIIAFAKNHLLRVAQKHSANGNAFDIAIKSLDNLEKAYGSLREGESLKKIVQCLEIISKQKHSQETTVHVDTSQLAQVIKPLTDKVTELVEQQKLHEEKSSRKKHPSLFGK